MVVRMRIDASNLLLAAQVQTRPSAAVKSPQTAVFQPAEFEAKPTARGGKTAAAAGIKPLGQNLDIKI
jgi:hypothetical protein